MKEEMKITKDDYDKLFPIGILIYPSYIFVNQFTTNMIIQEIICSVLSQLDQLNKNDFGAVWEYNKETNMIMRKE